MANNYTESFAGDPYYILKGEQLSAAGMTAALNTKEKVANKKDTVNNDSTEYPSSKAVYDSLNEMNNKLAILNSLSTLGFFPRGTILPFSSTAWDEASADFKKIWKICDGQNGTLNLVNKFIRGGAYADYGHTGGTDTAQLPYHAHEVYDPGHGHGVNDPGHTHNWVRDNAGGTRYEWGLWPDYGNCYLMRGVSNVSIQNGGTNISINPAGGEADNRPAFCTVIFIEKIMP
ncbi:MAG: hypothetical protein LBL50_04125 [Candidatus Margulisbacteria bacterium]|jgi:hypothetical protein|nr:hypothetical protein [Candidatus Margulisiibacteriota bacterium]